MRIVYLLICFLLLTITSEAQEIRRKIDAAARHFELDSQMRHAIYSLYVIDAKTGNVVFDRNSQIGLAPASCQKLFTSGAAFELLGHDYRFKTALGYQGKIENGSITGDLLFLGTGDPTLGSWRFEDTKQEVILRKFVEKIKELKVSKINGGVFVSADGWSSQTTPDGWIWQDIGNYYGAGSDIINWRENQYDVELSSGRVVGDKVKISGITPELANVDLQSEVTSASKATGDNAYIYLAPGAHDGIIRGTIPVEEKKFQISGSIPDPSFQFLSDFTKELQKNNIQVSKSIDTNTFLLLFDKPTILTTVYSPSLDSINYWFLRRSINLYGEALVKVIAYEQKGFGATDSGVAIVRNFWSQHGIDKAAINIIDGSGLSPQNRVTTNALVNVLRYAKTRLWYKSFYLSLPTYNGMKMKSGSIGGARSFAGYHTSKDGHEYIFAIIVNNYDGSSSAIVNKMYRVLDNLK